MKISPKRSPKSILEEDQTSRECHIKQAVANHKGRACHAKKAGEADREVARPDRATRHGRATCVKVAWLDCAMWHGRATCSSGTAVPPALVRLDFKYRGFELVWGE